jgi:hypothetical protein
MSSINTDVYSFDALKSQGKWTFEVHTIILDPGTRVEVCDPNGKTLQAVVVSRNPTQFPSNNYELQYPA